MSEESVFLFGTSLDEVEVFGAPMLAYLERAWQLEHDSTPVDFEEDLERLRTVFQSHVTGTRVREHTKTLPRNPLPRPFIPDIFFLSVDADRGMVTPEGRALIDVAHVAPEDRAGRAAMLSNSVALFYGDSLRTWMAKSIETGLVPLPSVGFAIFLLINGSLGEERAMRFPNQKDEEDALASVIMNVASTFSTTLNGPAIKPKERAQLRTSWVISQAVRHLGRSITRGPDQRTGVATIWIDEDRITPLLEDIARAIHARKAEPAEVEAAFDAAIDEYDRGRVLLGAWGISYERRRQTQQLRDGLLEAYFRTRS